MGNVLSEELAVQSHLHGKPMTKHNKITLPQERVMVSCHVEITKLRTTCSHLKTWNKYCI
jgi:hypothetical protein